MLTNFVLIVFNIYLEFEAALAKKERNEDEAASDKTQTLLKLRRISIYLFYVKGYVGLSDIICKLSLTLRYTGLF